MTPMDVFSMAMSLTDNLDELGRYDIPDNKEYKDRTLGILNTLLPDLYPFSDTYQQNVARGKRPVIGFLRSLDEEIDLDDTICRSVLTEGLAALLFHDENPSMASTHLQLYEERKSKLAQGMPAESEEIIDVYSGGYYDEDGMWHNGGFPYNNMSRWG